MNDLSQIFSWKRYLAFALAWVILGFLIGFSYFGIVWDPNGCRFFQRPVFGMSGQLWILGFGVISAQFINIDIFPAFFSGYPIPVLLVVVLIMLIGLGLIKRKSFWARCALYLACFTWSLLGAFRLAMMC